MNELHDLITRYRSGSISIDEKKRILELIDDSDESYLSSTLDQLWHEDHAVKPLTSVKKEELLSSIRRQLSATPGQKKRKSSDQIQQINWKWIAAACLITILGIAMWVMIPSKNHGVEYVHYQVKNGESPQMISLDDGSQVWLNAGSQMEVHNRFTSKRQIKLMGEASFDVIKDKRHPFTVDFGNSNTVRVTGTQFNIRAYPEEEMSVSVTEGSVLVVSAHDTTNLTLNTGLIIRKDSRTHFKYEEVPDHIDGWKQGEICFDNTPIDQVFNTLERQFGLTILLDGEIEEKRLTATYRRDMKIEDVMEGLDYLHDMEYVFINKDTLMVTY